MTAVTGQIHSSRMSEREKKLTINEIYFSVQGESTWAGLPCVFVRLTFCDLRCTYCDTEYAFYEGKKQSLGEIVDAVLRYECPLVEITGGEPLLQKNVLPLMTMLADAGRTVLLETSGAHDISGGRSAGPSDHGLENARERRSGAKPIFQHRAPDAARRSEIRHRLARRLRMVARASA